MIVDMTHEIGWVMVVVGTHDITWWEPWNILIIVVSTLK